MDARLSPLVEYLAEAAGLASVAMEPGSPDSSGKTWLPLADGRRLSIVAMELTHNRIDDLIGRFATAVLEHGEPGEHLLIVVHVPRFGDRSESRVMSFMSRCAPSFGWALTDDAGGYVIHLPTLNLHGHRARRSKVVALTPPRRLFTDLQRWLLKVLLYATSPFGSALGVVRPANPSAWSKIAAVSHQTAYSLARNLSDRGLLTQSAEGLSLTDPAHLLEDWLHEDTLYPAPRVWVRDALRSRSPQEIFRAESSVIGSYQAAKAHGLLRITGSPMAEIHVRGPLRELLAHHQLVRVEPRDADFALIRSPHPESVFRAAIKQQGLRVSDPLQAALDCVASPARGREQAEFIIERILSQT